MRKIIVLLIGFISLVLVYAEERSFFKTSKGNVVTVWKCIGDKCFILPGYYFGILPPSNCFIKSANDANFDIFWIDSDKNRLFVRSSEPYIISNGTGFDLVEINDEFLKLFYDGEGAKFRDIKPGCDAIMIFVKDDYALGADGKKLE